MEVERFSVLRAVARKQRAAEVVPDLSGLACFRDTPADRLGGVRQTPATAAVTVSACAAAIEAFLTRQCRLPGWVYARLHPSQWALGTHLPSPAGTQTRPLPIHFDR